MSNIEKVIFTYLQPDGSTYSSDVINVSSDVKDIAKLPLAAMLEAAQLSSLIKITYQQGIETLAAYIGDFYTLETASRCKVPQGLLLFMKQHGAKQVVVHGKQIVSVPDNAQVFMLFDNAEVLLLRIFPDDMRAKLRPDSKSGLQLLSV